MRFFVKGKVFGDRRTDWRNAQFRVSARSADAAQSIAESLGRSIDVAAQAMVTARRGVTVRLDDIDSVIQDLQDARSQITIS